MFQEILNKVNLVGDQKNALLNIKAGVLGTFTSLSTSFFSILKFFTNFFKGGNEIFQIISGIIKIIKDLLDSLSTNLTSIAKNINNALINFHSKIHLIPKSVVIGIKHIIGGFIRIFTALSKKLVGFITILENAFNNGPSGVIDALQQKVIMGISNFLNRPESIVTSLVNF